MADKKRMAIASVGATAAAVALIAQFEGYSGRAYDDGGGVQTIGFGSTRKPDGTPVRPGDTVTPQRAVVMLANDADKIAQELAKCVGDVPLYRHEWDAFVSLAYNVGSPKVCKSSIIKKLKQNPPDYTGACEEILSFNKWKGVVSQGLVNRRRAEYRLCMGEPDNAATR